MVKFDIEFSEWPAITAMLKEEALRKVKQIALEVHTWRDTVQDYVYFWSILQVIYIYTVSQRFLYTSLLRPVKKVSKKRVSGSQYQS